MAAQKKKGRYVYYHCTGHKGDCGEPYTREEEIAKQFGDALAVIQLESGLLTWLKDILRSSMGDEREYHKEAITALQNESKRLQDRLDALYVDKLDGTIDEASYARFSAKWRSEQEDIRTKIGNHEKSNRSYVDAGITLLDLASKAKTLYNAQPFLEKRRLLNYVFSNSTWKDGKLTPTYRQPFDMLADTNTAQKNKMAAGVSSNDHSAIWLPFVDAFRTWLTVPPWEHDRVFRPLFQNDKAA